MTYDTSEEERITIDERTLSIPSVLQTIGVENDNNVERVYFELPRYFDEDNDLSEFNIYINYMSANSTPNRYYCDDVTIEDDNIVFSWLTSRTLYETKGTVKFIVCAIHEDGREWNSTLATLTVLEGLETTEAVEEENADVINQIIEQLSNFTEISTDDIQEAVNNYLEENPISVDIPDTLPNPYALTFTGASTESYDGSSAVTVNIPSGTVTQSLTSGTKIAEINGITIYAPSYTGGDEGELLMAKALVTDTYLSDIADAIRDKNDTTTTYKPSAMASAISAISTSTTEGVSLSNVSVYVGDYADSDTLVVTSGAVNIYERFIAA